MPKTWTVVALTTAVTACASGNRAPSADGIVLEGDLARVLDARLSSEPGLAGAFLVARGGEVVFAQGYGEADRETGRRWTPRTVSDIGSLVKGVTGAAIVKLQEEGRLSITDTLGTFFDRVPADKRGITLHQLLTHTAGFGSATGSDRDPVSRDSLIALAMGAPLRSKPGASYRYSNTGYSILAAVVEKASGMPYERYVQERLFAPAGLRETGYTAPTWPKDRLAHGYRSDGTDWGSPLDQPWRADGPGWHLRGNGGMLSTVHDLYRWLEALQGDAVLDAESRRQLFAPHVAELPGSNMHYGYGWGVVEAPEGRRIWHDGGNPYFHAEYVLLPEQNAIAVALTNAQSPAFVAAWNAVRHAALTGRLPEEAPAAVVPVALLDEYAGEYRIPSGPEATIRREGAGLVMTSGENSAAMTATSETRFAVPSLGLTMEFVRDDAGRVSAFRAEQGGGTFTAQRVGDAPAAAASNGVALPDTPAGGRVREFLSLMASEGDAAIRRFVQETFTREFRSDFTMSAHLEQLRGMRTRLADAEVVDYRGSATSAVLRLRSPGSGTVYTARFTFQGDDARIAELALTR
ncbi:MAG TPA: serine hydrolase [Longimicrobiaceae bacterium]|nr:serine hydrolase [Longimicrobiaceae bacterium]